MDPAAIGTAMIGIESIRSEFELYEQAVPQRARRLRLAAVRRTLAASLQRIALSLDPGLTARHTSRTAARS